MKRFLTVLILCHFGIMAVAQSAWEFKSSVEENNYYLLEGVIDSKYEINMFLKENWEFCGEGEIDRWRSRGMIGWYAYKKYETKIPLIGSINRNDPDTFLKVFVPSNVLDTIDAGDL